MEFSAGSGLTLKYDVHDRGDRVGRLPLGKDLDEAAYAVHEDARVEGALKKAMEVEESKQNEYGRSLRDLTNRIESFGLTDKGERLDGDAVKRILRAYVLTIPGLRENYDVKLVAPSKEDYFRPAGTNTPEGYYCPSCNAFLMDRASTNELPDFCNCGNRLKF
jgi:hypothetical protein